jgi:mRNA interferase MazF
VKRGEIWTAAGGQAYAGKPRPVVILQSDRFASGDSVTVCPLTSDPTDAPIIRLAVAPDDANGLKAPSRIMVDKLVSVPRRNVGKRVGRLAIDDMARLERAILIFLGLMK